MMIDAPFGAMSLSYELCSFTTAPKPPGRDLKAEILNFSSGKKV